MSGHSHYATIKRQKGLKDAVKGKIFSKLGRAISIAVKAGGGPDPNANYKLRMAVDAARAENMPKENIERAISRASAEAADIEEILYEGFGPHGVGILVEAATNNRNRTAQEIKNLFDRGGGNMGGPGSVSFNFDPRGLIVIEKIGNPEEQMLSLIDLGIEDMAETPDGIEVYTSPEKLAEIRDSLQNAGVKVITMELTRKPKTSIVIADATQAGKVLKLLDSLEEYEDVQKVYANIDIPEDVLAQVS